MKNPTSIVIDGIVYKISDKIQREVRKKPHSDVISFVPEFVYSDDLFKEDENSIYFFIPNHKVRWQHGEMWNARITEIRILPATKRTKDRRRMVNIFVNVLNREEEKITQICKFSEELTIVVKSGEHLISLNTFKLESKEKNFLFVEGEIKRVIQCNVLFHDGVQVGISRENTYKIDQYLEDQRSILGKYAPSNLMPLINALPQVGINDLL